MSFLGRACRAGMVPSSLHRITGWTMTVLNDVNDVAVMGLRCLSPLMFLRLLLSLLSSSSPCSLRFSVDVGEIEEVGVICGLASTGTVVMQEAQR